MSDEFEKLFTLEVDKAKRAELCSLMNEWLEHIRTKDKILFADDDKEYNPESYFCIDGFFPGYFKKDNKKILFIARESRGFMDCYYYTDLMLKGFKENPRAARSHPVWKNAFYITYGIQHEGKVAFCDIPWADQIFTEMNENNDYGFALMNISKYSNDSVTGGKANFGMINRFLSDCDLEKRNFIREELAILDPDIIIATNLWDGNINQEKIAQVFPNDDRKEIARSENSDAVLYDFNFNGKTIKLIDTWHFSARKSPETNFYNPIMEVLFPNKK